MLDVSYDYAVPESGSGRKGFTQVLREMRRGGSVEVPLAKKASVYSSAKAAGVRVRIRTASPDTIRIWRIDGPEPEDIFGQPIQPAVDLKPAAKTELFK